MRDTLKAIFILSAGILLSAFPYLPVQADPTTQAIEGLLRKKANAGGGIADPTEIAGLSYWFTADTEVLKSVGPDVAAGAGETVVMWRDQSGNNNDPDTVNGTFRTSATRIELSAQYSAPLYNSGSNPLFGDSTTTVFWVFSTTDTQFMLGGSQSTGTFIGVAQSGNMSTPDTGAGSPTYYINGSVLSPNTRGQLYTDAATGSPVVVCASGFDQSGSNWTRFGAFYYASTGFEFTGDVYEVIAYNSTLSSGDQSDVEDYLYTKWSITP